MFYFLLAFPSKHSHVITWTIGSEKSEQENNSNLETHLFQN